MNILLSLFLCMATTTYIPEVYGFFRIKNWKLPRLFSIKNKKTITNPLQKINGFYGLIGPEMENRKFETLFDLFTRNGVIQGVFFNHGNITFVKHRIQTEKVEIEEKMKKSGLPLPRHFLLQSLYMFINSFYLLPNMMGVANTALLSIQKNMYALYERDLPYKVGIHFENKTINTERKVDIPNIHHFSGHSKWNKNNETVETIDCNVYWKKVSYFSLSFDFVERKRKDFSFVYIPIVHDFIKSGNQLFLIDSPFVFDFFSKKTVPICLASNKKTYMYVYNTETDKKETYECDNGFTIFHYADVRETERGYDIYGSVYDTLDFDNLNIVGRYRCIHLDKDTKKMTMEKNTELETLYNLDFPIVFGDKIISRNMNISKKCNDGFVITKGIDIDKVILYEDREILGEPKIVIPQDTTSVYLCFFNKRGNTSFLSLQHLEKDEIIDIPIDSPLEIGFHSVFLPSPA